MDTDLLMEKVQDELQARDFDITGVYKLAMEPVRKITAIYEQDTQIDIRVCVKYNETVITIYADHFANTLSLQKHLIPNSEENIALRTVSAVTTSAILVQLM